MGGLVAYVILVTSPVPWFWGFGISGTGLINFFPNSTFGLLGWNVQSAMWSGDTGDYKFSWQALSPLGLSLWSHGPPLLTMKECAREKVLKGKKSQSSVGPGGQQDQEHGWVLHDQEEGYQVPIISRTGSSQVRQGLSMTPPTHQGLQVDQVDSKIKDVG